MNWIGGLVAAVFIIGLLLGSLLSRQRENAETHDTHADKLDYPTSDDDQTSIGAAARAIIALAKDHQARHEDNRADGERDYRINRGVFFGVSAYTVFTGVILIITVIQYGDTRRFNKEQRSIMGKELIAAQNAAAASAKQGEVAEDSERRTLRAYVTAVASGGIISIELSSVPSLPKAQATARISFMGASPAYDVEADIYAAVTGSAKAAREVGGIAPWGRTRRSIVGPGTGEGNGIDLTGVSEIDAASYNDVATKGAPWVVWGRVDYSDVFGCYHYKRYCYVLHQSGSQSREPEECFEAGENATEPRTPDAAECRTSKWPQ